MSLHFEIVKVRETIHPISAYNDSYSAYTPKKFGHRRTATYEEHREITVYFHGEYNYMIMQVYSIFYDTAYRYKAEKMAEDILSDLRDQGLEEI